MLLLLRYIGVSAFAVRVVVFRVRDISGDVAQQVRASAS